MYVLKSSVKKDLVFQAKIKRMDNEIAFLLFFFQGCSNVGQYTNINGNDSSNKRMSYVNEETGK